MVKVSEYLLRIDFFFQFHDNAHPIAIAFVADVANPFYLSVID